MHLGNGAITPACAALTCGAATAGLGLAVHTLRSVGVDRRQLLTAGALGGSIFAAQLVNVPVLTFSSAHLVGGVLAVWVLGPPLGALSMAVVVAAQALLLGDGGILALGANILNMSLLPALLVAMVPRRNPRAAAGVTAALAVIGASLLIVGEVALFRSGSELTGLSGFAGRMIGIHAWIALPEGLVTIALLAALGQTSHPGTLRLDDVRLGGCWGAALLLVVCLLPFASPMPDGYEASAETSGLISLLSEDPAALASIGFPNATIADWQDRLVTGIRGSIVNDQALALLSTLAAAFAILTLASLFRRDSRRRI